MDKNTIPGLILIFAIFIGFSIYNNSQRNKVFKKALSEAELCYAKGELETARTEYINALNFEPNQPEVIEKLNELNIKLGIVSGTKPSDSLKTKVSSLHTVAEDTDDTINSGVFSMASK